MKFQYKILKEDNFLILNYCEKTSLNDLFNSINIVANDIDYNSNMSILNDLRDCEIPTDERSICKLTEYIKNNKKIYAKRRTALLTESPNQVVFSTLLVDLKKESLVSISIVSTLKSALMHLKGNTKDYMLINDIIKDLKSKCNNM